MSIDVKRRLNWYIIAGVFLLVVILVGFKYVNYALVKSIKFNGILARFCGYQKPPPFDINEFALEESAKRGDSEDQYLLALQKLDGFYYRLLKKQTPDFATRANDAMPIINREAALGNTSANFYLGILYDSESSSKEKFRPNTSLAIHYYKKAGRLEYSIANFKLFRIYNSKSRGYYNPNLALDYLEKYVKYYDLVNEYQYCDVFQLDPEYVINSYIELLIATRRYNSPYVRYAVNILLYDVDEDSIDLGSESLKKIKALADAGFVYAIDEYKSTSYTIKYNIKAQRVKNRVKDKGEQDFLLAENLIEQYHVYDNIGNVPNGIVSNLSNDQISDISSNYIGAKYNKYIYAELRYNLFLYYYGTDEQKRDALIYLKNIHYLSSPGEIFNIKSFHNYRFYKEVLTVKNK